MTPVFEKSPVPRFFALIPCAGLGSRAVALSADTASGQRLPKQYQAIAGRAMVLHTLEAFAQVPRITRCLVVVAPDDDFFSTTSSTGCEVEACGGSSRAASVLAGLQRLKASGATTDDWVLVHDAARCLITAELIERLIDACQHDAVGGLLAQPLPDTLKQGLEGRVSATLQRSDKWLAQTPQMFRLGALNKALTMAHSRGDSVTDEASAMEAVGLAPQLVRGSAHNFKVTFPEDFLLAEALITSRTPVRPRITAGRSEAAVIPVPQHSPSHEPL